MPELIWDGKYDATGNRTAPLRVALPFQTVETVNESMQERQRGSSSPGRRVPAGGTGSSGVTRNTVICKVSEGSRVGRERCRVDGRVGGLQLRC